MTTQHCSDGMYIQIKKANPEKACYLEYDKLYVDSKIFVWNEALGQVIEQAENDRYGADFMMSRPGTQMMMSHQSRPPSGKLINGIAYFCHLSCYDKC